MAEAFPSISILIPELVSGSEVAWTNLFEKFRAGLTSKARLLSRGAEFARNQSADDLVQETFYKAWNKHESFRGETTAQFLQWILTILQNTFYDWVSRKGELTLASWCDFQADDETPSSRFVTEEQEAALHACLAEMNLQQQLVLTLRHFEGLKFAEIAAYCDSNINTVASHCRRAISSLAAMMKSREKGCFVT